MPDERLLQIAQQEAAGLKPEALVVPNAELTTRGMTLSPEAGAELLSQLRANHDVRVPDPPKKREAGV